MQLTAPSNRLAPQLVTALGWARTTLTAGGLTVVLGLAVVQGLPGGGAGSDLVPDDRADVAASAPIGHAATPEAVATEALLARHRCSSTGFGPAATPRSALVRGAGGELRLVGLDRGWASFTGDGGGELVAVCLPAPR